MKTNLDEYNIIEFLEPSNYNFQSKLYTQSYLEDKYCYDFSVFTKGRLIVTDYFSKSILGLDEQDSLVRYINFRVENLSNRIYLEPYLEINNIFQKHPNLYVDTIGSIWGIQGKNNYIYDVDAMKSGEFVIMFKSYMSKLSHILNSSFSIKDRYIKDDKHIIIISKNRVKYRLTLNKLTYMKFEDKYL